MQDSVVISPKPKSRQTHSTLIKILKKILMYINMKKGHQYNFEMLMSSTETLTTTVIYIPHI